MRKLTTEELVAKLDRCPGWHGIANDLVNTANEKDLPLRNAVFHPKRGLRPIIAGRRRYSEEDIAELESIASNSVNVCYCCGCDVNGTCLCDTCCEEQNGIV